MSPDWPAVLAAIDGTWPPAAFHRQGTITLREGQGGGSRVSAATAEGPVEGDLAAAEAAMRALGQAPLFMVRPGEEALDTLLASRGYVVKDPVVALAAPVAGLTAERPPPVSCFEVWPPLAIQREIWATGGIGPERLAIMERAPGPRTTILGRTDDSPAGTLFVAMHGPVAMVHAVETLPAFRRRGVARRMMTAAAFWARDRGAETLALLVTRANGGANALYAAMGFAPVGHYHYRIKEEARP